MKLRHLFLLIIFDMLISFSAHAQTPFFSQYYSSALYLNPALAGLEKDTYLGMNYRAQWSSLSLPFNTFQFSFIQPITRPGARKKHLGGIGLTYFKDVAGANKEFVSQGVSIAAAHNVHLNRHGNNIIAFAFQAGASQQRINYEGLQWTSQYSSSSGFDASLQGEGGMINDRVFHPIVNAGAMWYYTNKQRNLSYFSTSLFNGISISNLIRQEGYFANSKERMSLLYKVHGGLNTTWTKRMDISPNYLVQWQDHNLQINLGMYMGYSISSAKKSKSGATKLIGGIWYRMQDAIIVSTGLSNAVWNLGFSYDSNVFAFSKTFGYGSSYELSLAYKVVNKNGFKRFSSPLI